MTEKVHLDAQGELQGGIGALNGISLIASPILYTQVLFAANSGQLGFIFSGAPFILASVFCLIGLILFLKYNRDNRLKGI